MSRTGLPAVAVSEPMSGSAPFGYPLEFPLAISTFVILTPSVSYWLRGAFFVGVGYPLPALSPRPFRSPRGAVRYASRRDGDPGLSPLLGGRVFGPRKRIRSRPRRCLAP